VGDGTTDAATEYFDLEVGLYRQDADTCAVELRFRQPNDQADPTPVRGTAQFDLRELLARRLDPTGYGLLLSQRLFADQEVLGTFKEACKATETANGTLRLRLYVDRSVPELHNLYWETLRDPRADTWPAAAPWLVPNQRVLLSRYGRSRDWRPVRLRPKGDLRALVFVANPSDVANETPGGRPLTPVDVPGELQRAREALQPIKADEIASDPLEPGRATLSALLAAVDREYDVVYLVCHGALVRRDPQGTPEPYVWLEAADGTSDRVPGIDLVDRLRDALHRPALVVLASCQSAGDGGQLQAADQGALAALGPRWTRRVSPPCWPCRAA
jgi:CHAT domain-containing protein